MKFVCLIKCFISAASIMLCFVSYLKISLSTHSSLMRGKFYCFILLLFKVLAQSVAAVLLNIMVIQMFFDQNLYKNVTLFLIRTLLH